MSPIEYGASRLAGLLRFVSSETLSECLAFLEGEGLSRDEAVEAVRAILKRPDVVRVLQPYRGWCLKAS